MPDQRRAFALLVMVAMAAAYTLPVAAQGDQTKAKMFIEVAQRAREIALEFVEIAKAAGKDIALATGLIEEGSNLLNRARAAYERGEYDSATAEAKLAQEKFRNALKALGPEKPSLEERGAEARLREAIERARARIKRVVEALSNSTGIAEDLQQAIGTKLNTAEGLLNEAESTLKADAKNVSEAARKLAQAEKLIGEAHVLLTHASHEPDRNRVEAFLKNMEREISGLRNELERLAKRGIRIDDLSALLDQAESLLKNARGKMDEDEFSGALSDLQEAREITQQVRREMAKRHKP